MRLLRSFFGRSGSRAVAVLLATLVCAGGIHASWDDAACDPTPVHHDHNAHRLREGTLPAGGQDHCLFCHSLRALRNGLVAIRATVADSSSAAAVRASAVVLPSRVLESHTPSRAPPSILL